MSFTPEHDTQFLARMIVATREGHQIASKDAQRLNTLATFGDSHDRSVSTMPEERRSGDKPLTESGARDVVRG